MALSNPTIGEITMFGGTFAPRGWAFCSGQLLAISENQALFSILGTTYGGDGRTTFALPDLRGRTAISTGTGPGLTPRPLGQRSGQEVVTLTTNQMPSHTHYATVAGTIALSGSVSATMKTNDNADTDSSDNTFLSNNGGGDGFASSAGSTTLNSEAIEVDSSGLSVQASNLTVTNGHTGASQSHNNMQPYTVVGYIIALIGEYPSRN